jgi:sulfide:quinone oxidoreductase
MTAGRAFDMDIDLKVTIATPEERPLAIFGEAVSDAVSARLAASRIDVISSAYPEVPHTGEVVINPGDRHVAADRVVALPELFGPSLRGIPLSQHGFIKVNQHGRANQVANIYAAGDATDFPVKHGGVSAQQADVAAEAIAALAGADISPQPFHPVIRGMLLTGEDPIYMTARITGGQGFSSEVSDGPMWNPPTKIASRYLSRCLNGHIAQPVGET